VIWSTRQAFGIDYFVSVYLCSKLRATSQVSNFLWFNWFYTRFFVPVLTCTKVQTLLTLQPNQCCLTGQTVATLLPDQRPQGLNQSALAQVVGLENW
jgi:hypothetical protein